NRTVTVVIDDGAGHVIWTGVASTAQAASTTVTYQGTAGVGEFAAVRGGILQMPFPSGMILQPGRRFRTVTPNLQAGDQWSGIVLDYSRNLTTALGTSQVTWYVGQKMPGPTAGILPPGFIRWQFPSIPGFKDLSGDQVRVQPNQRLVAGVTGLPVGTNILC